MKVLLVQLDGRLPNLALMRLAAHHRAQGDEIELRRGGAYRYLWDHRPDRVYASLIFEKTRPFARDLLLEYPNAILGGTGWSLRSSLERFVDKDAEVYDYSIYPTFRQSIGFSQRGCRLKCPFCVVPEKEGAISNERSIFSIWRGDPWPREVILLDNDFFGHPAWPARIHEHPGYQREIPHA